MKQIGSIKSLNEIFKMISQSTIGNSTIPIPSTVTTTCSNSVYPAIRMYLDLLLALCTPRVVYM